MDNKDDGKQNRPSKGIHPNSKMHNNWSIGEDPSFGESSWKSVSRESYNQSRSGAPPARPRPAYEPGQGNRSRDLFGAGNNNGDNAFAGDARDRFQSHSNSMHSAEHSVSGPSYSRTRMYKTASQPSTIGDTISGTSSGFGTRSFTTSTMDATRDPISSGASSDGHSAGPTFAERTDLGYNFAGLAFDGRVVERSRKPGAKLNFDRVVKPQDPNKRYNIISGREEPLYKAPLPGKHDNKRPPLNSLGALRPYMDGDEKLEAHYQDGGGGDDNGYNRGEDNGSIGGGGGGAPLTEEEIMAMAHARVAAKMREEGTYDAHMMDDERLERDTGANNYQPDETRYG